MTLEFGVGTDMSQSLLLAATRFGMDVKLVHPPEFELMPQIMEEAKAKGEGATVYKGRLVDIASIKQAEVIVRQSDMIAG